MVPNPTAAYVDTLARRHHDNQKILQPKKASSTLQSRPSMRSRSSLSVEELREITQKMNLTTSNNKQQTANTAPKKMPFGRSYSAPVDLQAHAQRRAAPAPIHKHTRNGSTGSTGSYSDGSVSSSGSSATYVDHLPTTELIAIAPPSRYHTSRMPLRRVTFNERVEVFELYKTEPATPVSAERQLKIRAIKKDTIKFHDQVAKPVRRPTSRVQRRMTSYIKDKLKSV